MSKKGITVWLFSSLTFAALMHLIDATSALIFNNEIRLLQLYPFIGEKLQTITPPNLFHNKRHSNPPLMGNNMRNCLHKPSRNIPKQDTLRRQKTKRCRNPNIRKQKRTIRRNERNC